MVMLNTNTGYHNFPGGSFPQDVTKQQLIVTMYWGIQFRLNHDLGFYLYQT